MAHLLRNSATAILANAELLRRHGDALEPDLTETLWTRLERHANAIASVCAEIARTEPVLALDKAHELTELLRAEADREALGLSNSDEA